MAIVFAIFWVNPSTLLHGKLKSPIANGYWGSWANCLSTIRQRHANIAQTIFEALVSQRVPSIWLVRHQAEHCWPTHAWYESPSWFNFFKGCVPNNKWSTRYFHLRVTSRVVFQELAICGFSHAPRTIGRRNEAKKKINGPRKERQRLKLVQPMEKEIVESERLLKEKSCLCREKRTEGKK